MAGTKVTADVITDGSITAAKLAPGVGGTSWQATPKTADFTAVSGEGYFIDTTSSAVTVTLPSSPSVGDSIILVDSSGTSGTNVITLASPNKIQGTDDDQLLQSAKISAELVYSGSSKGWVISASANEGTTKTAIDLPIEIDLLVVGGGGGAGSANFSAGNLTGGGGGAGEFLSISGQEIELSSNYTVTVGAGGGGLTNGSNSRLLTSAGQSAAFDYTCNGGGGGANKTTAAASGGSGGGGSDLGQTSGASAVKNEEAFGSLANSGSDGFRSGDATNSAGGAGGGAGAAGGSASGFNGADGGAGFASSITGTSVTYAGGGAGGAYASGGGGTGGSGGGGNASAAGTVNTGGGGGGGGNSGGGGAGGSGIVIVKYPNTLNITVGGNLTSSTDASSVSGFKITTFTAGEDTISWALV